MTVDADSALMVTVVPAKTSTASYQLSSWTSSPATNSGSFAGNLLLTTTFTPGSEANPTWTANGTTTATDYTSIQSLSSCSSATNVTDSRNHVSYTVAPITVSNVTYCYMLSNLRLDASLNLTTDTSDVTANTFTTPADQWSNNVCRARMRILKNEYYYNWYAAKANIYTGTGTSCTTDYDNGTSYTLGSICPKGWTLPTYASSGTLTPNGIWNSGANLGMLMSAGYVSSGSQTGLGTAGRWWSFTRSSNTNAYALYFNGSAATPTATRTSYSKQLGLNVRCIKK